MKTSKGIKTVFWNHDFGTLCILLWPRFSKFSFEDTGVHNALWAKCFKFALHTAKVWHQRHETIATVKDPATSNIHLNFSHAHSYFFFFFYKKKSLPQSKFRMFYMSQKFLISHHFGLFSLKTWIWNHKFVYKNFWTLPDQWVAKF